MGSRIARMLLVAGVAGAALATAPTAGAEQSTSRFHRIPAAFLDADGYHTCAILTKGRLRCWGEGGSGELGYGNTDDIGETELPSSVGTVSLGTGRKARAIALGEDHTCVILNKGQVRCWGEGGDGRLGYGNENDIGDNEVPSSVGPVNLGAGRRAVAITAGEDHTCAILDNGKVRCWGAGDGGGLGYGNEDDIGDNETPGDVGTVFLGTGRKARAIGAGGGHTCALLDNGRVRCWGYGSLGELGYGNTDDIGDNELPGTVGPVILGRRAVAIGVGEYLSCAILDNGNARCWGFGDSGQLGIGNENNIGDNELPTSVPAISLGAGRRAIAISAGYDFACALLDNGRVRCWGYGGYGALGYGNDSDIGDNELPSSVSPVSLGSGRTARAISTGWVHACALLDNGRIRCWGEAVQGQLGYGNTTMIGDNETPDTVGPVSVGARVPTRVRPSMNLKITPRRDRSASYHFRATGKLTGFIGDGATCFGKVKVQATNGGAAVSKRVFLHRAVGGCSYTAKLTVGFGPWKVTARFPGNGSLRERRSGTRPFRAG
jgi:alpha-tubulin suppressor-like RCC1 family protein